MNDVMRLKIHWHVLDVSQPSEHINMSTEIETKCVRVTWYNWNFITLMFISSFTISVHLLMEVARFYFFALIPSFILSSSTVSIVHAFLFLLWVLEYNFQLKIFRFGSFPSRYTFTRIEWSTFHASVWTYRSLQKIFDMQHLVWWARIFASLTKSMKYAYCIGNTAFCFE